MTPPAADDWAAAVDSLGDAVPPPEALIGRGESAEVFLLTRDAVLKLYFARVPRSMAEREFTALQAAGELGLPTARVMQITQVAGRNGIVLEYLPGANLHRRVAASPIGMTIALARLARYHARMHRRPAPPVALPSSHAVLGLRIASSQAGAAAAAGAALALAHRPQGDRLCHGDLHLGNMIAGPGGLAAIDWSKATIGDPAADVARSELLLRYGKYGRSMRRFPPFRIMRHLAASWYLLCYWQASGVSPARVRGWTLPVAVSWMQGQSTIFEPGLARAIARRLRRGR